MNPTISMSLNLPVWNCAVNLSWLQTVPLESHQTSLVKVFSDCKNEGIFGKREIAAK